MSETPKFTVIDRRKIKAEEEQESAHASARHVASAAAETSAGPRLVVNEPEPPPLTPPAGGPFPEDQEAEELAAEMPPPPSAEESKEQRTAYDASAQRLEDLLRAQNPGMGAPQTISFDHLVQQLYVSAMIQMGAGTQEGQRPRVDILAARQTIDLLGILADKTRGNLTDAEDRTLQAVLYEARMAFLELTHMITLQGIQPPAPPPPPAKR